MNWLTRFFVDMPTALQCRYDDCYGWHKAVWQCFPGRSGCGRDFLFRLDEKPQGTLIHVLSEQEPTQPSFCQDWETKAVQPSFLEHRHYRFDIVCNPGRKVKAFTEEGVKKNSRRVAIIKAEEQKAWFLRKAEEHGFIVPNEDSLRIDPTQSYFFRKEKQHGTHIGVRFCGVLTVTDRALFQNAYCRGLGSARGFGFGLLLLAPVR